MDLRPAGRPQCVLQPRRSFAREPVEYLTNFYGPMLDTINGDDDSDRLLVRWRLHAPEVAEAALGQSRSLRADDERLAAAVTGLGVGPDGEPVVGDVDGPTVLVAVPRDIHALRSRDPLLASLWRKRVREVLAGLLADGARIDGFDRDGWYVIRRDRRS